jgi:hypothetical protein
MPCGAVAALMLLHPPADVLTPSFLVTLKNLMGPAGRSRVDENVGAHVDQRDIGRGEHMPRLLGARSQGHRMGSAWPQSHS